MKRRKSFCEKSFAAVQQAGRTSAGASLCESTRGLVRGTRRVGIFWLKFEGFCPSTFCLKGDKTLLQYSRIGGVMYLYYFGGDRTVSKDFFIQLQKEPGQLDKAVLRDVSPCCGIVR